MKPGQTTRPVASRTSAPGGTGSRVYAVPGGGWVNVLDATTLVSAGDDILPSPDAFFIVTLACARNGNVYVGSDLRSTGDDLQAFNAAGASIGTLRAGPDLLAMDLLELSGDETRFAAGYEAFNFGQYAIAFRDVPP